MREKRTESVTLPWDRFGAWVHAICVVTFDLELGQALEVVYPGFAKFTEKEKTNICYLAFPDSNSGCMGDTCFHFRMRRFSGKSLKPAQVTFNQRCPISIQIDSGYYYGFTYFRQVRDKSVRRGYLQKSVVLITQLPLVSLFSHVIRTIAPEYFELGEPGLEAACHDLDQWSWPVPGVWFSQPLMGSVVQYKIPSRFDPPNQTSPTKAADSSLANPVLLPTCFEPQLFENLAPVVHHVQLLWELVLLGEPLVVMAPSPTLTSGVVQSLVSLIWPLRYSQDYRPFFTIHDSEFKEYTSRTQPPANVILGVTNPFFTKTLQHWPHIIRLADENLTQSSSPMGSQKMKKSGDVRTLDNKPGVYSQYKTLLTKDKALLKRVAKGVESKRPAEAQSAILRRHFWELTQSFIIPLERYVASLMPLQRQISPFKAVPQARQFDFNEFICTLDVSGPALTTGVKGDWIGLYTAFVKTVNFEHWLRQRQLQVQHKLNMLHLEVLCSADFTSCDLNSMPEVQIVDLVLKLRDKIAFVESNSDSVKPEQQVKLHEQMRIVLSLLSEDLRTVLLSNTQLKTVSSQHEMAVF